jgi:hypothetical protein
MRLIAVTLALAGLLSAATSSLAAPAPLPRRDREAPGQRQQRLLDECSRRLRELGVKWSVVTGPGGRVVRYFVEVSQATRSGSMHGEQVVAGDLPGTLRRVIRHAVAFVRNDGPY